MTEEDVGSNGQAGADSDDSTDPGGAGSSDESVGAPGAASESSTDDAVVRRDRFAGGPAREFMSSLSGDRRIFAADLAVDRAHVVMLAEQGIVEEAVAGEILAALDDVEAAVEEDGYDDVLAAGEDVHEAIETAVIERVGADGGRMHTARSRNDEVASCIRYRLRADLLETLATVLDAREALLEAAAEHRETLLPGYTHLQPAQPITVGFWLASYEGALARDAERLLDAYGRVNRSPLGAAAFAGTTFDVDRERTAALLGFTGDGVVDREQDGADFGQDVVGSSAALPDPVLVENATDAVSARDFLQETAGALSALATTCSGLAEDVVVYANRGLIDLDDDYASTSSIMPQKKNPDSLELVRAVAGDAAGAQQALATTLKGLPRSYNRDLQRAGPHVWELIDDVTEATAVAGGAVATAEWNESVAADAAAEGFSTATGVADLLAHSGVPFRTAHHVVAEAAPAVAEGDADPIETLEAAAAEHLEEPLSAYVDADELAAALDPEESVASRDSRGGPAPAALNDQLERAGDRLTADREAVEARRATVATADERLREEVATYV